MALYGMYNKSKFLTIAFGTLPASASARYSQLYCPLLTVLQSCNYPSVLSVSVPSSSPCGAFIHAVPSAWNCLLLILSLSGSFSFITSVYLHRFLRPHNLKIDFLPFFLAPLSQTTITACNYMFTGVHLCYVCLVPECERHEGRNCIYFVHH